MTKKLHIIIEKYGNSFTAYPLEIEGVVSQGYTKEEALKSIQEAIKLHLTGSDHENCCRPEDEYPDSVTVAEVEWGKELI